MKAFNLLLFGLLSAMACPAQVSITRFTREGQLTWTNHLCATRPVYEILGANSPTGPWQQVAFVTNQTSIATPDPGTNGPGSRFYKLRWADDAPLVLDYFFDEGYGCLAVSGQLTVTLWNFPAAGSRVFYEEVCNFDGLHPLGSGLMTGYWTPERGLILLLRRNFDDVVWLEGALVRTSSSSPCSYLRYSGTVFQETLVGPEPIGVFYAEPAD